MYVLLTPSHRKPTFTRKNSDVRSRKKSMFAFNKLRLPPNHHTFTRIFDVGLNLIDLWGRGLFFWEDQGNKSLLFCSTLGREGGEAQNGSWPTGRHVTWRACDTPGWPLGTTSQIFRKLGSPQYQNVSLDTNKNGNIFCARGCMIRAKHSGTVIYIFVVSRNTNCCFRRTYLDENLWVQFYGSFRRIAGTSSQMVLCGPWACSGLSRHLFKSWKTCKQNGCRVS